jgi:hypothetical protein
VPAAWEDYINFDSSEPGEATVLSEKFFLFLETLMSHAADDNPVMVSSVSHIPNAQETALHGAGAGASSEPVSPDDEVRPPMP